MSEQLYVCWTNNCRGAHDYGLYIFHAVADGPKTLCGCEIQEIGVSLDKENMPSCKRCLAVLRKKGITSTFALEPIISPPASMSTSTAGP